MSNILRGMKKNATKMIEIKNLTMAFVNGYGLLMPNEALNPVFLDQQKQNVIILFKGVATQVTTAGVMVDQSACPSFELKMDVAATIPHQIFNVGDTVTCFNMFHVHPSLTELHFGEVIKICVDRGEKLLGVDEEESE